MKLQPYETGAAFWRDTASQYGLEEAYGICGRYLSMQIKTDSQEERQFCRELFRTMMEAKPRHTDPAKLMYPYPIERANERMEASLFHESAKRNSECARGIDNAISASCYKTNHYNLELAAMLAIHEHGFIRVNAVLAHTLQQHEWDGRYSRTNKEWAKGFTLTDKAFHSAYLNAHPILVEDVVRHTRKLYDNLGAERYMLPGHAETGAIVQGYEITRSISFNDQRGFAIGMNPDAAAPYVAWQFTLENGKRDYYWGHYSNDMAGATENYIARIMVYMSSGDVREVYKPLLAVEMSMEQNCNMLDGIVNNVAPANANPTDGQTREKNIEYAPKPRHDKKASVLDQLRETRKTPPVQRKQKEPKSKSGLER